VSWFTKPRLSWAGVPHGIIGAGLDRDHNATVLIMSVQSTARRLDRLPNLDFAVADEGHHSVSPSWAQVLATWPEAKILGATATPERLDRKGLGASVGGIFDSLVIGAANTKLQLLLSRQDPGVRSCAADRHSRRAPARRRLQSPASWRSVRTP
jgi:hypothetical protein